MRVYENIALAKAILNRNNIVPDSDGWKDYLKIREIVGNNHGYVGILTKLRFEDEVTDMEEIKSIFDVLKNSKIDISKLIKLSYDDILHKFYDELSNEKIKNKDIELVLVDKEYSYYRVYTYEGILKIGSPSWCLKTKKNWEKYQKEYPDQWVVIDNRYKNKIISADDSYLSTYNNTNKAWIRFGVSVKMNKGYISWIANNDNNNELIFNPVSHTFYGVLCTILNLYRNVKKPYYEYFIGCEPYEGFWHKVKDFESVEDRLKLPKDYLKNYKSVFITLSSSYSTIPILLTLNATDPCVLYPMKEGESTVIKYSKISSKIPKKIFEEYALESKSRLYCGVKLLLQKINENEIIKYPDFIKKIGRWFIFDHNDNYYLIVNSNPTNGYQVPTKTLKSECWEMENPVYWYLHKKTNKPYKVSGDYTKEVIDSFKINKKKFWE